MTSAADTPAGDDSQTDVDAAAPRRIAIGTQRPGVRPPSLAPRPEYVAPPAAPAADAPSVPPAAASPADPPPAAAAPPRPTSDTERDGGPSRRRGAPRGPRADQPRTSPRVAVPNVRAALDDELAAEFDAALAGVEVDTLLAAAATGRLEAPLEPGTRVHGTVLAIGPDTAFVDLGGRRQGALKLAGLVDAGLDIPAVGATIEVEEGQTILDAALRQGIYIPHACGHGLCGTCKVTIESGDVDHGAANPFALMDFERDDGKTLACCATLQSDTTKIGRAHV